MAMARVSWASTLSEPCEIAAAVRSENDEINLAGAIRKAPVQLARCQTVDLLAPAWAEIVIEGNVHADREEPHDAKVHEPGEPPLHVQPERQQRAQSHERRDGGQIGDHARTSRAGAVTRAPRRSPSGARGEPRR